MHVFLLSIYSERPLFPSVRTLTLGLLLFLSCSLYCSLVLHSLPPFLSSLTKSIGGIPHLSKTNIRICLLVFSSLSIPSYCWDSLQILQFVNLCRFFSFFLFLVWGVELLGNHNQHMQVKAVKKNIREKVLEKWLTLWWLSHPEARRQHLLCVCVFECNLWSRWLESWAESSRSQSACHQDDGSWLLPLSFS